jgi:uncharacterized protein YjiS (DUF1127 family)
MQAVSSYGYRNESLVERVPGLSALVRPLVAFYRAQAAKNALRAELNSLSDRDLDDIGVSRDDISAIVRGELVGRRDI